MPSKARTPKADAQPATPNRPDTDPDETRGRLFNLEAVATRDFPSLIRLVGSVAVGVAVGMDTLPPRKLVRWLLLVERGFRRELDGDIADRASWLAEREDDPRLVDFADRVLRLDDEKRERCTTPVRGARTDSEELDFAPRRRGPSLGVSNAPWYDGLVFPAAPSLGVILSALRAIGPTAKVGTIAIHPCHRPLRYRVRVGRPHQQGVLAYRLPADDLSFRWLRCLATKAQLPCLWTGSGDWREALTTTYVQECAQLVRMEYDLWIAKQTAALAGDNPILAWLREPSESNRLRAMSFAALHANGPAAPEPDGKRRAFPEGFFPIPELAKFYNVHESRLDAFEKAVLRWRSANPDPIHWKELTDRGPHDPKYIFASCDALERTARSYTTAK